jgi:hypothetical protein
MRKSRLRSALRLSARAAIPFSAKSSRGPATCKDAFRETLLALPGVLRNLRARIPQGPWCVDRSSRRNAVRQTCASPDRGGLNAKRIGVLHWFLNRRPPAWQSFVDLRETCLLGSWRVAGRPSTVRFLPNTRPRFRHRPRCQEARPGMPGATDDTCGEIDLRCRSRCGNGISIPCSRKASKMAK